ncbi:holo-ACP synthase [Aspergillus stella-maris]|uniref:holo-ACP synthase n=1 Tax=Aspergillus stella-maris TaxID=1810926 RepID=UPI003CCD27EC
MKPPLPFPLQLNIGTDIVHLSRITRLISRPGNYLSRFTRRILTDSEMRDFRARFDLPLNSTQSNATSQLKGVQKPGSDVYALNARTPVTPDMARWLAGRFAAKEAGRKAARGGAGSASWKDVVVRVPDSSDADGHGKESAGEGDGDEGMSKRPEVILFDQCPEGRIARLSISHDGEYVVATVLAAG